MKKIIILGLAAIMLAACTQTGLRYRIKCDRNVVKGNVTLVIDGKDVATKEVGKNGKVTFTGTVDEPKFGQLLNSDREPVAEFIVEKGTVTVTDKGMSGTHSNDVMNALSKRLSALVSQYYDKNATEESRMQVQTSYGEVIDSTFKANTDNFAGVALLMQMMQSMSIDQIRESIDSLSPEMQKHTYIVKMKSELAKYGNSSVGQKFADFTMPDAAGKDFTLSSVAGKGGFVLLDFWASWCNPCMEEMPYVKSALETFGPKGLTLVGVSLDDDSAAWKAKIKELGLGGIQLSSCEGWETAAAKAYSVSSIPANFLIGPDGKIVAKNLRGTQLAETLQKYLK